MSTQSPVLVRIDEQLSAASAAREREPSVASSAVTADRQVTSLRWLRLVCLALGVTGLGFYGYTLADDHVYQSYQDWAFEEQIAGHRPVTFADYLRAKTPLHAFSTPAARAAASSGTDSFRPAVPTTHRTLGSLLGRVEVPRLHLSAIVREGSNAATLSRAVGHVPSTGLAGRDGNFAIAAHRDTLFRALQNIQMGDIVNFETTSASFRYQVFSTRVVKPSEVSVLRPDAGLSANVLKDDGNPRQLLTMITCYPFRFVGSAPERFIVTARLRDTPDDNLLYPAVALPAAAGPKEGGHVLTSATHSVARAPSQSPGRLALQTRRTRVRITSGHKHHSVAHKAGHPR